MFKKPSVKCQSVKILLKLCPLETVHWYCLSAFTCILRALFTLCAPELEYVLWEAGADVPMTSLRAEGYTERGELVPQGLGLSRCCRTERVQYHLLPVESNSKKCSAKTGHCWARLYLKEWVCLENPLLYSWPLPSNSFYSFCKATHLFRKGKEVTIWESLRAKTHCIANIYPTKQLFQYSKIGIQNPLSRFFSLYGVEVNTVSTPQRILCDATQLLELCQSFEKYCLQWKWKFHAGGRKYSPMPFAETPLEDSNMSWACVAPRSMLSFILWSCSCYQY